MAFFFFGVGQRRMRAIVYETGLIFSPAYSFAVFNRRTSRSWRQRSAEDNLASAASAFRVEDSCLSVLDNFFGGFCSSFFGQHFTVLHIPSHIGGHYGRLDNPDIYHLHL